MMKRFWAGLAIGVVLAAFVICGSAEAQSEKWVALFNGKDLTGWKTHPDDKAKWEV
ncbi:MAG: hypothetical protein RIR17_2060, partial [Planctomycetota bacterium]